MSEEDDFYNELLEAYGKGMEAVKNNESEFNQFVVMYSKIFPDKSESEILEDWKRFGDWASNLDPEFIRTISLTH